MIVRTRINGSGAVSAFAETVQVANPKVHRPLSRLIVNNDIRERYRQSDVPVRLNGA